MNENLHRQAGWNVLKNSFVPAAKKFLKNASWGSAGCAIASWRRFYYIYTQLILPTGCLFIDFYCVSGEMCRRSSPRQVSPKGQAISASNIVSYCVILKYCLYCFLTIQKKWLVSCVMHSFQSVPINSAAKLSRKLNSRYENSNFRGRLWWHSRPRTKIWLQSYSTW